MVVLKLILIILFIVSLFIGLVMIYVVGGFMLSIMSGMISFLNNMGLINVILFGIVFGVMMCFDLGGLVNKVVYIFGVGLFVL